MAHKRIEKVGVARWLFDFAYADIEAFSAGEIIDTGFDILALVIRRDPKEMNDAELVDGLAFTTKFSESDQKKRDALARDIHNGKISREDAAAWLSELQRNQAAPQPHVPFLLICDFHKALREKFDGFSPAFTGNMNDRRK